MHCFIYLDKSQNEFILFSEIIEKNIRGIIIVIPVFERKEMENINEILIGKTVLNAKGNIIGKIQDSIKDRSSGEITSVLIAPSKELDLRNYTLTAHGKILLSYSSLSPVKDIFIVEEPIKENKKFS